KDYGTPREARQHIRDYMAFYNHEHLHQSLDYQTPGTIHIH
ncbi:integrase core domain-containing protein, partial [Salinicoccus siamensis]